MASKAYENQPAKKPTFAACEEEKQPDQDFISALPDEILHIILSKLRILDAAVTTAVSKRWAPLFPTLPSLKINGLSFNNKKMDYEPRSDDEYYVLDRNEWFYGLFSVLDSRITPIKKLDIAADIFEPDESEFYEFFRDVCADGVEGLSITCTDMRHYCYKIPSPIFACTTITKLENDSCRLVVPSKLTGLRSVKTFVLSTVLVDEVDLRRMISRCKAMEKLVITDCLKAKNIVIRAPNLTELVLDLCRPVGIVLKSVPRLTSVSVSFGYNFDTWKFDYASLEDEKKFDSDEPIEDFSPSEQTFEGTNECANLISFLNRLCGVKDLSLNFSSEYRQILSNEGMAFPTRLSPKCCLIELKKLCLHLPMNYQTFNMIISCLLNSSPCLTEIIIYADSFKEYKYCPEALEFNFWDKQLPAECVKHHLTTATFYLDEYISEDCFVFPKFLLLNAGNLKSMNIVFYNREPENISKTKEKIRNDILATQMASPDVVTKINSINWHRYTRF